MQDETTVNAADIARLADVGRTAVSNWRRRYADFPQPVGGTPASPLFALTEVEAWLRVQDKLLEIPLAERAWQELRARAGDDLQIAATLADVADLLARGQVSAPAAIAELAAALGAGDAFEVLLRRFQEMQARRAATTPPEIAELMATLAGDIRTVLDPACGTGELLLAARDNSAARRLLGQDIAADSARLAGIRLRLRSTDVTVRTDDSLRRDAFPGVLADAVLCDPPFHERSWGHEELTADPRWIYGLPPRLEPELAWVQHALAHLAPGGLAVVLMPAAAAGRRPGRRIRAQLLRKGALRAVLALSATHHVWLLRRPASDPPGTVLMVAAADLETIITTWQRFDEGRPHDEPGVSRAVPIIDLLDEEVDLTPAYHLSAPAPERTAERFTQAQERLGTAVGQLRALIPDLRPSKDPREFSTVTIAELARIGHLTIRHAPLRRDFGPGEQAVLTAEDVIEGRPASGRGLPDERLTTLRIGDIAVATSAGRLAAMVLDADGAMLGPGLTLLRADPRQLDPHFVAGALRSSANVQASTVQTGGTGRADIRRAQVPQLPLAEQRRYGDAFRRMEKLESAIRVTTASGAELAQLLADGVREGTLLPPEGKSAPAEAR
jgi:SAM-dependent methyltransferase